MYKEVVELNYKIVDKNDKKYIEYVSAEIKLSSEEDVLDIVGTCFGDNCSHVILHGEVLSEDFFNLKTKVAGMMLQKFINYHIKVAVILPNDEKIKGRFGEMVSETNKGKDFRVFKNVEEAEKWLLA